MRRLSILLLLVPWALPLAACGPGDDTAASCDGILAGELVITEIFADHDAPPGGSGADEGKEWFEIYNASGAAIDLEGVTVVLSRPDGASDHTHVLATLTIGAGEYGVLGNVLPEFVEGHLDYGYADALGDMFNNDGGKLVLRCGDETIDEVLYDEVETGRSTGFDGGAPPDYTANDDLTSWCTPPDEASFEFETQNYGTPGAGNYDCQGGTAGMCDDGGTLRPTVTPAPGDLVITEVHPNPSGDDGLQEWLEILVVNAVDLNGIKIGRSTGTPTQLSSDACIAIAAGTRVVIAKSLTAGENGNLPRVDGLFTAALADPGDIRVLDPADLVLDAVAWTNAGAARTWQLDPDFSDPASNDMERYWCDASIAWSGADLGSPGAANEECTILPPAGMCTDPDTALDRDIVEPTVGQLVITEVQPNPSGTDSQQEWIEVRATTAVDLNGLKLQRTGATPGSSTITDADCVEVAANTFALFARAGAAGLPAADATYMGFDLVDTCSVSNNCDIRVTLGDDTLIDAITWTDADSTAPPAARQLDDNLIGDATGNDNEAATVWCDATAPYNGGADLGTPKADNRSCD